MTLLILDGNSIINRAFYGIKLLTTKNGDYTNAIYGFLNMLKRFEDMSNPDAIVVAFDMHAPTFRHKIYDDYKAGRHSMPDELYSQMPVLKNLLHLLGIKTVECEGWEADDIIGTFAQVCREKGDLCYICTGDRDSLQLAHDGVKVLLARTKSTDVMDENAIFESYGVQPIDLIQVKALQGDSSDNIPGVKGIGEKTALDLISRFKTVDYIYEHINEIDVKPAVRNKLINDKDNAYLSLKLGEIVTDAPVDTDISNYLINDGDKIKASAEFVRLELFSLIDKFNLNAKDAIQSVQNEIVERNIERLTCVDADYLLEKIGNNDTYFYPDIVDNSISDLYFCFDDTVIVMPSETPEYKYFVRNFFENENCKKYTYNSKYLHRLACQLGIECKNVCGDLMLSAYLLKPSDNNYSVEHLCLEYSVSMTDYKNSLGLSDDRVNSAAVLKPLFKKTDLLLQEADQVNLLNEIELPLARVLAKMETVGFSVDKTGIENFGRKLGERISELTAMIFELVGYEFNINSPKQLGIALFDDLQLPYKKKTRSGYSTNADVLESLRGENPVIEHILEYRSLTKLKSTYCDGLLKSIADDGRIHTSFNQVETRTGRISSLEPNLQNIPIRTELGREMRKFFVAGKGNSLVDADYSQIELRVLSDLANDENMINAFNSEVDIHTSTAAQVFNMPVEMVTKQMRSSAKAVNFGIVYGIGAFSLAKDIGVTRKQAQEYIDNYLNTYSGVREYMSKIIDLARDKGYSSTLFNRRRYLPELNATNFMARSAAERIARNMPVQGTAADIIKIAMIKVDKRITEEKLDARLILQVHDELIVESSEKDAERVLELVTKEMESACKMKVKLRADGNIGKTWYDAH